MSNVIIMRKPVLPEIERVPATLDAGGYRLVVFQDKLFYVTPEEVFRAGQRDTAGGEAIRIILAVVLIAGMSPAQTVTDHEARKGADNPPVHTSSGSTTPTGSGSC